jgi:hypothetical protein
MVIVMRRRQNVRWQPERVAGVTVMGEWRSVKGDDSIAASLFTATSGEAELESLRDCHPPLSPLKSRLRAKRFSGRLPCLRAADIQMARVARAAASGIALICVGIA